MLMPGWNETLRYRDQLVCQPIITSGGDSGAVALDDQSRVVGMVVGGWTEMNETIITPISTILNNSAWGGAQLELLTEVPADAVAPNASAAGSIVQRSSGASTLAPSSNALATVHYASLVPNGSF